jgi:hypothetical protein
MNSDLGHIRLLVIGALAGALLGCASAPPEPHAGKPEVTISGASIDRVKTALVAEMSKRKFRVAKETASEMSFEQPAASPVLQGLSASAAGKNPIERITYTMAATGADLHVTADIVVVRKLAAMEQPVDIGQGPEAQSVQAMLDKIAGEVGAAAATKREN